MRRRGALGPLVLALLLLTPGLTAAGPQRMSDEELDAVTAGDVQLKFGIDPDENGVGFSFDLGSTFGDGSVILPNAPSVIPSTVNVTNGNVDFSNTRFTVENMILNLNLCVQCKASVINQIGFGVGITIK